MAASSGRPWAHLEAKKLALLGLGIVCFLVLPYVLFSRSRSHGIAAEKDIVVGSKEYDSANSFLNDSADPTLADPTIMDPTNSTEDAVAVPIELFAAQNRSNVTQMLKDLYPTGPTWKDGFCKEFLVDTFDQSSSVCKADRILCKGVRSKSKMCVCTLKKVAMLVKDLSNAFHHSRTEKSKAIMESHSMWLLRDYPAVNPCPDPNFQGIENNMESIDYARSLSKITALAPPRGACNYRIAGTTYMYMGIETHIYFKVLAWYNLHRSIMEYSQTNNYTILRVPDQAKDTFLFSDFEKVIYPEVISLQDLEGRGVICFDKMVLVPWSFAAPPFRCKMDKPIKNKCLKCDGKGLHNDLHSFRSRVISGCGLKDRPLDQQPANKSILIIKRKQYHRRFDDTPQRFKRIWTNSNEFIDSLKRVLPQATVTGIYAEDLTICEQISLAHSADVLIGIHGAGLVHLWWLQQHGIIIELVPRSEIGNEAFALLAKLLGRKHIEFRSVTERDNKTEVDIGKLIDEVKKLM